MAVNIQIKYTKKNNRIDPHERIHSIRGVNPEGTNWSLTLDEAITAIEADKCKFYTSVGGELAWVVIASNNGHKYLKTEADGLHPNSLLSLPESRKNGVIEKDQWKVDGALSGVTNKSNKLNNQVSAFRDNAA